MNSEKTEKWGRIPGHEELFLVSNHADIMALDYMGRGICKILELSCEKGRYIKVTLRKKDGGVATYWLHQLVARVHVPNPDNKPEVDHIDGNRLNNDASNLRWVTHEENVNNPNTIEKRKVRYHREGEFERRSAGQKKRFERPEEQEKLQKAREKRWQKKRKENPPTEKNREKPYLCA